MRTIRLTLAASLAAFGAAGALAQDAFDACEVFTAADATSVLGANAAPEPVNPKVKRPKVVATCTYTAAKDGKNLAATATWRFSRSEADAQRAFEDERLKFQTKPLLLSDAKAFWSAKQGQLHVLKGRTWIVTAVGGAQPAERDAEASRRLAEALVRKP